ncbi:Uncharacterized protein E3U43_005444 [Larimichthys crocea]|uniref:Uncharacterized protein n=1 Tax=Larimichthys crocea TaxID=215358 RepID=A0ACD3QL70_LARCR|nr:Uncharacterized protein E3U43_005444 [Larimichthys crocea]
MSNSVQTTSDGLCKLVRWAHSHGTICDLIPSLQHFTCGSYNNMLTPEPGPNGSSCPCCCVGLQRQDMPTIGPSVTMATATEAQQVPARARRSLLEGIRQIK